MKSIFNKKGLLYGLLIGSMIMAGCGSKNTTSNTVEKSKPDKIIVGTDTSYVPFEFLDTKTDKYVGFDIDLLKSLSEEAKFEYELKPMDFSGIIPALQTNNLDMAIAGITINDEREKVIDFSEPYYDAGTAILVRADEKEIKTVEDLKGKIIATKQGTSSYDYAMEIKGVQKVVPFPNIDQAYMELEKGAADAVVFDLPNVQYYIKTNGDGKVKITGDLLQGQSFGIAFPKDSKLRDKVDAALKKLVENGTYDELYKKWFDEAPTKK